LLVAVFAFFFDLNASLVLSTTEFGRITGSGTAGGGGGGGGGGGIFGLRKPISNTHS
tara:strand:- start:127 stop:297 length:171 start_codon:yes stop_codon:yes gene_type:complete